MEITANTPATVTSAKGAHAGTIATCCRWAADTQAAYATITADFDIDFDIDAISFDAEDPEAFESAVDAVISAIEAERA